MQIDIDTDKYNQPLGMRERLAIRLLLMAFFLVAPFKYRHQVEEFFKELWK